MFIHQSLFNLTNYFGFNVKQKDPKFISDYKEGLINLYRQQLKTSNRFMNVVLTEAIRKLKDTEINPVKVENWVVKLEKEFNKIIK